MPSRRALWILGLTVAHGAVLWATYHVPDLGAPDWHHAASLVLALAIAGLFWRPLVRSRRFLAIGVLVFTVLATASGFWLLYWKEGLRADGLQDWGRFWHVLWSWFATVFFFQHTWINRVAYANFFRRTFASMPGAAVHASIYVVILAAILITWSALGRDWFTNENYIPLTLYTWLVATVPPYTVWSYVRFRARHPIPPAWTRTRFGRQNVRLWVSVLVVPMALLAVVSGIPLTFMDALMDQYGLKYVSKYWHVWPSVAFAVLVFAHSIHLWHTMRAHWRRVGVAVGDVPDPRRRGTSMPTAAAVAPAEAAAEDDPRRQARPGA